MEENYDKNSQKTRRTPPRIAGYRRKVIFERGEKGISVQEVVNQANVATGLFYYYFKSKDEFLDEALNGYVSREILSLEKILDDRSLSAYDKLEAALEAYFKYALKMAPARSSVSFHTERHYTLTEKLIARIKNKVSVLVRQGMDEKVFNVGDVNAAVAFLLNGLTCVFDMNEEISEASLLEIKRLAEKVLKG